MDDQHDKNAPGAAAGASKDVSASVKAPKHTVSAPANHLDVFEVRRAVRRIPRLSRAYH